MGAPQNKILNEFLIESFENLSSISDELTYYEKSTDSELLNSIYRKVHTVKGSASFLGFSKLESITHIAENVLDLLRENKLQLSSEIIDVLLESFDIQLEILKSIEESAQEPSQDYDEILQKLKNLSEGPKKTFGLVQGSLDRTISIPSKLIENSVTKNEEVGNTPVFENKIVDEIEENVENVVEENSQSIEKKIEKIPERNNVQQTSIKDSVVRVNVSLLDKIMNVVSELVLTRNQILQHAGRKDDHEYIKLSQQLNTITTELQSDIMTTRMQPVGSVIGKFERVVRDIARKQGKKISLVLYGQDTELDKTLLDAIKDPLTHLVRNSVDHGIEKPEDRLKVGKREEGTINIKAYHEGGQVTIEINDDGKGIDKDVIKNKAIEKGVITEEEAKSLNSKQVYNLLFAPGFSTAERVSEISGRGVGMDVVKSNIEKIGGSIEITSKKSEGSCFKLKIPLTLAIVPAIIVRAEEEVFAIPQVTLVELVRIDNEEGETNRIEKMYDSEFLRLRGELIPIFRLSQNLSIADKCEGKSVVILKAENIVYGILVDEILDMEEIVVKPLSKKLKDLSYYAGSTIMGDGSVALILDTMGYITTFGNINAQKETTDDYVSDENEQAKISEVLLCRLSDEKKYSIPLEMVDRLEEFELSKIEWSADQSLIRYCDKAMKLIDVSSRLKVNKDKENQDIFKTGRETLPCIVVESRKEKFGIIVDEILDIEESKEIIDRASGGAYGLLGTLFVKEQIVPVIDILEIIKSSSNNQNYKKISNTNLRILHVDDSSFYQVMFKECVEDLDVEVVNAFNGKEALEILTNQKFDLIVTDVEMPVMSGWELIESIKLNEKYKDIPIVSLTTRSSDKDMQKSLEVGANKHLAKIEKNEIVELIESIQK